jgi:hypothetical protein
MVHSENTNTSLSKAAGAQNCPSIYERKLSICGLTQGKISRTTEQRTRANKVYEANIILKSHDVPVFIPRRTVSIPIRGKVELKLTQGMVIFTFLVIIAVNHRLSMGHLPVTSNT